MENPIVTLSEKVQSRYGKNIETEVLGKTGPDHCPTVEVKITLPNGMFATAKANNQKLARQKAAEQLLKKL